MKPSTYISIDPGPHTGIAIWYPDMPIGPGLDIRLETLDFTTERAEAVGPHSMLFDFLEQHVYPKDVVICEKFEYQKEKAQTREHLNYDAAEYVGVVKCWSQRSEVNHSLYMQSPSQAVGDKRAAEGKIFWDDAKLKSLHLYVGGRDRRHEMDALRHLLYHVTFTAQNHHFIQRLPR